MQEQLFTRCGWLIFPKDALDNAKFVEDKEEIKISSPSDGGYTLLPFLNEEVKNRKQTTQKTFKLFKN